jgi:epoxyqueuosine reductase
VTLRGLALTASVKARAVELGFHRVAVGPATPPPHGAAFEAWLEAGHAGTMSYLARGRDDRLDPARLLPGARSVIAVALGYGSGGDDPSWRGVASYARGRDYHEIMRERLQALAAFVCECGEDGVRTRVAVDTSAVLERDLAARAGLGWIGKNTNLLAPGLGSLFFIGIVLTTAALVHDGPLPDRCGTCTACLQACPTAAFVAPYVLDARRCISYLTIEHRGDIDPGLRDAAGEWLFGCDVCQDVCPWNRKAPASVESAFRPSASLEAPETLLAMTPGEFRARFRGSAISRAKRAGLLRNAALVLGNRGDAAGVPALVQALHDPEPSVRTAAAWALRKIDSDEARAALERLPEAE